MRETVILCVAPLLQSLQQRHPGPGLWRRGVPLARSLSGLRENFPPGALWTSDEGQETSGGRVALPTVRGLLTLPLLLPSLLDALKWRYWTGVVRSLIQQVAYSDVGPVMMLSEASVKDLSSKLEKDVTVERFRPNIVIGDCEAFDEVRCFHHQEAHVKLWPCWTWTNKNTSESQVRTWETRKHLLKKKRSNLLLPHWRAFLFCMCLFYFSLQSEKWSFGSSDSSLALFSVSSVD